MEEIFGIVFATIFLCVGWFIGTAIISFISQLLWNNIVVNIFNNVKRITFWQMFGFIILIRILFPTLVTVI